MREDLSTVASEVSRLVTSTTTFPSGALSSTTVKVTSAAPSRALSEVGVTV